MKSFKQFEELNLSGGECDRVTVLIAEVLKCYSLISGSHFVFPFDGILFSLFCYIFVLLTMRHFPHSSALSLAVFPTLLIISRRPKHKTNNENVWMKSGMK